MKEYKSNEELINYLLSKGVVVSNKKGCIRKKLKYIHIIQLLILIRIFLKIKDVWKSY